MIKKLLLSVLAIFGFAFLLSQNTYAVTGETLTLDEGDNSVEICGDTTSCSSYNYMIIEYNYDISQAASNSRLQFSVNAGRGNDTMSLLASQFGYYVMYIHDMTWVYTAPTFRVQTLPSGWSITVTLTNESPFSGGGITPTGTINISENGTFDVTNYASAVVSVDQTISDLPPYSELVVDSFWKYHVAIAGGLASVFAIFVVYRIIKSRLR